MKKSIGSLILMSSLLFSCGINESNSSSDVTSTTKKTCRVNFIQLDYYLPSIKETMLKLDGVFEYQTGYEFIIDVEKDKARPAFIIVP